MNTEAVLDALAQDASATLREVLRRAYETGYREGLSARGMDTGAVAEPAAFVTSPSPLVRETSAVIEPDGAGNIDDKSTDGASSDVDAAGTRGLEDMDDDFESDTDTEPGIERDTMNGAPAVDWGGGGEQGEENDESPYDDEDGAAAEPLIKPISSRASIGTLRNRIVKYFSLERFDVDVVLCRKGDRSKRQLNHAVRLSTYLVQE